LNAKALDLKFASRVLADLQAEGPMDFSMDDALWNAFTEVLEQEGFEFTSIGEMQLERLMEDADELDYITKEDVAQWKSVIAERRGKVLETDREAIQEYLEEFLVSKRYGNVGTLERGLTKDELVLAAAEILQSDRTMQQLLSVK
jgi:hypothetical protein